MNRMQKGVGFGALSVLVVLGSGVPSALAATSGVAITTTASQISGSTGSSGRANVKLSQDDVLNIAKGLFPDLFASLGSPAVGLQPNYGGETTQIYNLSWSSMAMNRPSGPQLKQSFTNILIDANTGQVIQYQRNPSQWINAGKTITSDEALEIAKDWIQKLAPNQASDLVLQTGSGTTNSGFVYQFMREVNGIVAPFDSARISLDQSGELVLYHFSWHDATFQKVQGNLKNITDATAKYRQDLNLELRYQSIYAPGGMFHIQLAYQPKSPGSESGFVPIETTPILNAATLQWIGQDGKPITSIPSTHLSSLVANGPATFPKVQDKPMSQESLEKIVEGQFGLSGEWALSGTEQQSNWSSGTSSNHPTLDLNYLNQKTQDFIHVQVDMLDGVVLNFNENAQGSGNQSSHLDGKTPEKVDAQAVADAFVKKLFPDLTGAIAYDPSFKQFGQPGNQKSFNFDFLIDGIPVNGFNLTVDTDRGTVLYYGLMQDPSADFPSAQEAITKDAAKTIYLKKDPVLLQYVLPETQDSTTNSAFSIHFGNQAQLVYGAAPLSDGTLMLDALTGDLISLPDGISHTTLNLPSGATKDEQAMAILEQNGVVIGDETKADLSKPISHAEFIAWLSRAYNYNISGNPAPQFPDVTMDNPYAGVISQALMQGWLPNTGNLRPDALLTRDDAARWLVEWMNWEGPALHTQFFKIPFSDVSDVPESDRGAAAMMSASDILPLENGKFNPSDEMTIGDAAEALTKAIDVLLGD